MSEALNIPTEIEENEAGLNGIVTIIQSELMGLEWLQKNALGRLKPQLVAGKLEPWIQRSADSAEYYPAYPNDTVDSFSCLYFHDDEECFNEIYVKRTLSIIVWANLQAIKLSKEELKRDVRGLLRELDCVMELGRSVDQTVTGAQSIYPGFDVSGLEERYNTYPYTAFRLECIVYFADLCY
ncbi:hypothetical protein [Spirosoma foliorum]|uniref:Uncharacterized protein n=1 Tax=Spirosoma foliorum TaxID=2710596 RepID=A0A7G5H5I0_9BACT|nr:hypothetical protein [Spirosoma foliorum]QMW06372.1 hypothetical protein H3H32_16515 [Spirosoma foliorum]